MNTYRALLGRRRVFLSQGDADAYDQGVRDHAAGVSLSVPYGFSPYVSGWVDAAWARIDAFDAQQKGKQEDAA